MRTHYPRTPHLPWSPGAASDDVRLADLAGLTGCEVVVTEKLDGENTTLYADGLHARSLDSAHHPSRGRVKALQGRIGPRVPAGGGGSAARTCSPATRSPTRTLARDVKAWAAGRGLDSAPCGGLPGLAWAVLAARTAHEAGDLPPLALLRHFFGTWRRGTGARRWAGRWAVLRQPRPPSPY